MGFRRWLSWFRHTTVGGRVDRWRRRMDEIGPDTSIRISGIWKSAIGAPAGRAAYGEPSMLKQPAPRIGA